VSDLICGIVIVISYFASETNFKGPVAVKSTIVPLKRISFLSNGSVHCRLVVTTEGTFVLILYLIVSWLLDTFLTLEILVPYYPIMRLIPA
jgi:hypothetical protein